MSELVIATYNVHGGVDGWGRPFDVAEACRRLDADVLVLEETWHDSGAEGLAQRVARVLGYAVVEVPVAPGHLHPPPPGRLRGWGPTRRRRPGVGLRIDPPGATARGGPGALAGSVGLAVLVRPTLLVGSGATGQHAPEPGATGQQPGAPGPGTGFPHTIIELGQLAGDLSPRLAIVAELHLERSVVRVVGTHMSHLRHGSPVQLRRLRRALADRTAPVVLVGDMNLWGPPLGLLFPGWTRARCGPSWPTWRPVFQIDHVLVRPPLHIGDSEVVRVGASDHFPLRVVVHLP